MTAMHLLWLPILLSSVIVFIASSLVHMVLPWHKHDFPKLSNEDQLMDALRPLGLPPGDYFIPRPGSRDEMKSSGFAEKARRGPVVLMTVMPNGMMNMGKNLVQWFVYVLIVGSFADYVTGRALPVGATYRHVFRFAGITAFIAYSVALWPLSIWYRRAWMLTIKATIDGLIYGLLTAGTFGWLWPR
jgi:hypothetical protein